MNRTCELHLVDFAKHAKKSNKHKLEISKHEIVEEKQKKNRKECDFTDRASNIKIPTTTERLRNKSKSKLSSISKRAVKSSDQQSIVGMKNNMTLDILKLNTSVEACGESIKLYHPKLGCCTQKRRVSTEKNRSLQKKANSNLNIDTKQIKTNVGSICNIQEKNKKKKPTKCSTHHKFWENNLTGARRVSKRLTNLKLRNKNSINPEIVSEKCILTIYHRNSNQENKLRAQRSTSMNVSQKKLKKTRKTTLKKPLSARNQPKVPSRYGRVSRKKQLHSKVSVSNKQVLKQNRPSLADLNILKISNEFCETENILETNPTSFDGRDDDKASMVHISDVLKSGVKEVSSSSVDEPEGANGLDHTDLELAETANLFQNIEENCLPASKIDGIIPTNTAIFYGIQQECEENTEITIIDIKTENGASQDILEKHGNFISSEYSEEKDPEEKETNGSTNIVKLSNLLPSDENHTSLEIKTAFSTENSGNDEQTTNNSKDGINSTSSDILVLEK